MHQPHEGLIHSPAICHQYKGDPFEGYAEDSEKNSFFQVTKAVGCWVTLTFAYGFKHLVTAVKIENRKEPGKTSAVVCEMNMSYD